VKRGGRLGVVLRWAGIVVACALIAVVLARWWTVRSEAQFAARLRSAPLSELEVLSRKRAWDPEVFYWLGARLTSENRHREAAQALAAVGRPQPPLRRRARGVRLGRWRVWTGPQDAEAQLKAAVELDPKLQFAHFALGNLYGRNKRWEKAVKALKAAAELDPNDLEAQYLLALSYGEMFQEDRKMEVLERLVKRAPNEIRFLKSLGFIYLFFGKFAQAEATYRHILELNPRIWRRGTSWAARWPSRRAVRRRSSMPKRS
jgi:tetratricopeptide (TPR) repeat protein